MKFDVDIRYVIEADDDEDALTDRLAELTADLPPYAEFDAIMRTALHK